MMDDFEIVGLFWERSEAAIGAASDRYSGLCFRVAFGILRSREDAEECVNDALARAWGAIPPARPERLSAFLAKIARNLAFDRWERGRAQKRGGGEVALLLSELEECGTMVAAGADSAGSIDEALDGGEIVAAIEGFLAGQKASVRRVFMRRYWYADSLDEIAGRYGMSAGKVKSILFRARKGLRAELERKGVEL